MSSIRLYMDEDSMDRMFVRALRERGIEVTTAFDKDMIERTDQEHLEFAAKQDSILVSYNVADYSRIHKEYMQQGKSHAGIILISQQRYSLGEKLKLLLSLIQNKSPLEFRNNIIYLKHN